MKRQEEKKEKIGKKAEPNGFDLKMPISANEMRTGCVNGEFLVANNLPIPQTQQLEKHCCVSHIDATHGILAHGLPVDVISS